MVCKLYKLIFSFLFIFSIFVNAKTQDEMPLDVVKKELNPIQRIERLERMVQANNQPQLEIQNELSILSDEVSNMKGKLELYQRELAKLQKQQVSFYQEMDQKIDKLAQNQKKLSKVENNNNSSASSTKKTSQSHVMPTNDGENKMYETAVSLVLRQKDYKKAIPAFQDFLSKYPNSIYVPNAYYWLGQLYYTLNDLKFASNQFNIVIDKYPKSNKVSDCLLKLGIIAQMTKDKALEDKYFGRLFSEYPESAAAGLARRRLENNKK